MHIIGYVILVFGVVGILLGLYGLLMPVAKRRGLTFTVPRLRLRLPSASQPDEYGDQLEDVLAELESSSFRNSPFEVPPAPPAPVAVQAPPKVIQVTSYVRPAEIEAPIADPAVFLMGPAMEPENEEEEAEPLFPDAPLELAETESIELEPEPEAPPEEEEPAAAAGDGPNADMMALFDQVAEKSAIPEALREAVPVVAMEELVAEARACES